MDHPIIQRLLDPERLIDFSLEVVKDLPGNATRHAVSKRAIHQVDRLAAMYQNCNPVPGDVLVHLDRAVGAIAWEVLCQLKNFRELAQS